MDAFWLRVATRKTTTTATEHYLLGAVGGPALGYGLELRNRSCPRRIAGTPKAPGR